MKRINFDLFGVCRPLAVVLIALSLTSPWISALAQSTDQQRPGGQENRGIDLPKTSIATPKSDQSGSDTKPEIVIQSSHTKPINAVAFSPDTSWLASAANDDTIKIWDISTGYLLRTLYGHSSNVNALAVCPDG